MTLNRPNYQTSVSRPKLQAQLVNCLGLPRVKRLLSAGSFSVALVHKGFLWELSNGAVGITAIDLHPYFSSKAIYPIFTKNSNGRKQTLFVMSDKYGFGAKTTGFAI
jgi:hypothetical protein